MVKSQRPYRRIGISSYACNYLLKHKGCVNGNLKVGVSIRISVLGSCRVEVGVFN